MAKYAVHYKSGKRNEYYPEFDSEIDALREIAERQGYVVQTIHEHVFRCPCWDDPSLRTRWRVFVNGTPSNRIGNKYESPADAWKALAAAASEGYDTSNRSYEIRRTTHDHERRCECGEKGPPDETN